VRDTGVRQDVVVDVPALYLAHGLDLFAVLFRLVVLLAVLMQPMVSLDVGLFGERLAWITPLACGAGRPAFLQLLDETAVRFLAVLAFGVSLRSSVVRLPLSHWRSPCVIALTDWAQARGQRLPPVTGAA
jgi:hypothetical protein